MKHRIVSTWWLAWVIGLFVFGEVIGAVGATYFVAMNGSDANPGTVLLPWRTIQKAANTMVGGDTTVISPGNYAEYVVTKAHGTSNSPVRFRANPPNVSTSQVMTKQFRVQHRFNSIEGFNLSGAQDLNMATIRIEFNPPSVDGSHTLITNNTLRDAVYLIADDLQFNSTNNGITTLKENWLVRGFEPGGYVFLGSNSKNPYRNHDTPWRIKAVTASTIYLTNNARAAFLPEPVAKVWGVIYAGNGNNACPGIEIILGSGITAATNCTIVGNTFSNLFGCPIKFNGENHLVEGNLITRIHGYYAIQPQGRNQIIRNNLFKDCTNFIFFTQHEMLNIPHPPGGNYFDYQVAFLSSFVTYSTNILFERNWIQNAHNQMGLVSHATGSYGFIIRSNVFVGVQTHLSGSRSGLSIENNTFYRCSFDENRNLVLGLGGTGGVIQKDLLVRRNAFIDCGSHYSLDNEGYYGVTDSLNPVTDYNFVCGPETVGYAGKRDFDEPNGINGGDPVLLNAEDPLGPDGLPFTSDDGLRPLANSPFASFFGGALAPLSVAAGVPFAHFRVASPTGWFDRIGTNFNPSWALLQPYERGDVIRPYSTPEALGTAPVTAVFSASNSIGGQIVAYRWNFGNGQVAVTSGALATNTFGSIGTFAVTLTVSNSIGNTATAQRRYRVLPAPDLTQPLPPTNLRVVTGP